MWFFFWEKWARTQKILSISSQFLVGKNMGKNDGFLFASHKQSALQKVRRENEAFGDDLLRSLEWCYFHAVYLRNESWKGKYLLWLCTRLSFNFMTCDNRRRLIDLANTHLKFECVTKSCSWSNLYTVLIRLSLCFLFSLFPPPFLAHSCSEIIRTDFTSDDDCRLLSEKRN